MSLKEIRDNYHYMKKKYDIKSVILTGGEPTLHSEFWKIMDFFYNEVDSDIAPSLNTNSLRFSEKNEADKLTRFLTKCNIHKNDGLQLLHL